MAEGRPRLVLVPPGGTGLSAAFHAKVKEGTVVTAFDDTALAAVKNLIPDENEAELVPFGSLVARVAGMCGDSGARRWTKQQLVAAIRAVCADLPPQEGLGNAARLPGLARAVAEAITELHQHEFNSADLTDAAASAPDHLTGQILEQLAFVETELRSLGHRFGLEFGADRAMFCLGADELFTFPIKHLLVMGSKKPQPLYEKWLAWLATNGVAVDVVMEEPPEGSSLFQTTIESGKRLGAKHSTSIQGQAWLAALFSKQVTDQGPEVAITHCPDPLSECEWVVRECQKHIRQGEYEGDITIYARRPEEYVPLLVSTARRLGLRVKGVQSAPLLSNGFARATLSLLRTLAGNDVRHIARIARSTYFPSAQDEQEWIDQACLKAHLSPDPWQTLAEAPQQESAPPWLPPIIEWRSQHASTTKTLPAWLEALRAIWNDTTVLETLIDAAGTTVERDGRAIAVMQRSLSDAHVPGNDQQHTLSALLDLTHEAWDSEKVIWSDHTPGIAVCSSTDQLVGASHVFALGLVEGVMPARREEHPVLNDEVRAHLAKACPHRLALPSSHVAARAERDEFVRICGSATVSLNLSCPVGQDERKGVPAFYLTEIQRARPNAHLALVPPLVFAPMKGQPASDADLRVREALDGPRIERSRTTLTTEEARQAVRATVETGTTLQRIAEAASCPFRSGIRHALRLKRPWGESVLAVLRDVPHIAGIWALEAEADVRKALDHTAEERILREGANLTEHELKMLAFAKDRVVQSWVEAWRTLRERLQDSEKILTNVRFKDIQGRLGLKSGVPVLDNLPAVFVGPSWQCILLYRSLSLDPTASTNDRVYVSLVSMMLKESGRSNALVPMLEDKQTLPIKIAPWRGPNIGAAGSFSLDLSEVQDAIGEGIEAVTTGAMHTSPGTHCQRCDLADLCRDHAVHGESALKFSEARK